MNAHPPAATGRDLDPEDIAPNSTRAEVRRRMFERALAPGERNPGLDGEAILAELERLDAERPSSITYPE